MIKSMARLLGVDPGFKPKNVVTMGISVPQEEIYVGPPGLPRFCRDLDEQVGTISGVVSVGAIAHLPFRGNAGRAFQIEGRPPAEPGQMPNSDYSVACPNYFRTMGIPSEWPGVYATRYPERARGHCHQRDHGPHVLAEGRPCG
jgi:putative ABC transport system permease protein